MLLPLIEAFKHYQEITTWRKSFIFHFPSDIYHWSLQKCGGRHLS